MGHGIFGTWNGGKPNPIAKPVGKAPSGPIATTLPVSAGAGQGINTIIGGPILTAIQEAIDCMKQFKSHVEPPEFHPKKIWNDKFAHCYLL